MNKRLKQIGLGLAALFIAAQFIRPDQSNPPVDPARTIAAQPGVTAAQTAVLDRACNDCHSNATRWPWYTQIAPLSWAWAGGVKHGRSLVNFSEWAGYPPERQKVLLNLSCQDVRQGRMPMGAYITLHPEAKLTAADIDALCALAH